MTKEDIKKIEEAALSIGVVMPRCSKCSHWKRETFNNTKFEFGICTGIDVDIEIDGGWSGGVVDNIQTDENFFCASFNEA